MEVGFGFLDHRRDMELVREEGILLGHGFGLRLLKAPIRGLSAVRGASAHPVDARSTRRALVPRRIFLGGLTADQHHDYQAWVDNDRRLRELLARLEALGAAAFEADPRWDR